MPLKIVSERVGYASQAGFLRAFKGVLGVSPTVWRRGVAAALNGAVAGLDATVDATFVAGDAAQ